MSVTILTGLPGSGKSETVIRRVNALRREGCRALTFMCSESPTLLARRNITKRGRMGCRAGLHIPVDHFVSSEQAMALADAAPVDTLLVFDEAQHFSAQLVESWCAASTQGASVLIASPSAVQLEALADRGYVATRLRLLCQACGQREATASFSFFEEDRTESVCGPCRARLCGMAEVRVVDRLRRANPNPGKERLHLPVELPGCVDWSVVRDDSHRRVEIVRSVCASQGFPGAHSTYLDVGCNTGFFCWQMARSGFHASGVEPDSNDIEIARLLSSYFRFDHVKHTLSDVCEYLRGEHDGAFDVVSAFDIPARTFRCSFSCDRPSDRDRGGKLKDVPGCAQTNSEMAHGWLPDLFRVAGRVCILELSDPAWELSEMSSDALGEVAGIEEFMRYRSGLRAGRTVCREAAPSPA